MTIDPNSSSAVVLPGTERQQRPAWHLVLPTFIVLLLAVGVGFALALVPVPYVIFGPGPTFDVLGKQGDVPILEVQGAKAKTEQTGQLRMVTVSEMGGPGQTVTSMNVLRAWVTPGYSVKPFSEVYPANISAEQVQQAAAAQMESSHSTSAVAALEYLGYDLPTTITIEGAVDGSGAEGILKQDDRLISVKTPDGVVHPMNTPSAPFSLMKTIPAGTKLDVTIERDGKEQTLTVPSTAGSEDSETTGSKLGILLSFDIDMPVEVVVHLEKVGGPSAGTIFALGIIDELTGEDMTGGQVIAGTGSLSYDGVVEPIGGIVQKMHGSLRDGADWFLAPRSNCDSVVGQVPKGLQVFAVGTLDEAVATVKAIGQGDTSGLTTCEMVMDGQQS